MSDFGAQLKLAREERGISLRQIATATKISVVALEALERNDFSRLPGGIFSRAFVRAYALEVGLDPDETVKGFLVEFEQNFSDATESAPPEVTADDRAFLERQRRAARWLRGVSLGLLLLLIGLIIWWGVASRSRSTSEDRRRAPAGDRASAASGQASREAPTAALPTAQADSVTRAVPPPTPPPSAAPPAVQTASFVSSAATPGAEETVALHLQIHAECWVRVTVDNTVMFEQILGAGDVRDVKPGRDIYLQVGNAGAVTWSINGQPAKELGKSGQTAVARITRTTLARYLGP